MKKRTPPEKNARQPKQPQGIKYRPKWATTNLKPWAPYSHALVAKRQQCGEVNVHIFAGEDRWKRAERRNSYNGPSCGLVLPEHAQAQQFRWPVLGTQVLVVMAENHKRQNATDFAEVLHSEGADLIVVVYGPGGSRSLVARDELRATK